MSSSSSRNGTSLATEKPELLDYGFTGLVYAMAIATVGLLLWLIYVIFTSAGPSIKTFGLPFIWSNEWDVGNLKFGALPYVYGTLMSSLIAFILALPSGLAVALMTSEDVFPSWVRSPVAFLVELIAAIPSVIIGLWGIFVFIPAIQPFHDFLHNTLGWLPIFSTSPFGYSLLTAGMVLAIMIVPTLASISRDVLLSLPSDLRRASMALGATRWETIFKVLLPSGMSGIVGATILALGRALGETMAVTMVIGNSIDPSPSWLSPAYTIPAVIANEFGEAIEAVHIGSFMYLALILLVLTLAINVFAVYLVEFTSLKR